MTMALVTIVSGCPGAGKTTLSRELALLADQGLHVVSDTFYKFPVRPLDPTTPESQRQNTSIMRALGRAADAFAEDGYSVVIDGVIGPWLLPVLVRELSPHVLLEYVVLQVALEQALARVRQREGQGRSAGVVHMHRAFSDLGQLEHCTLDTSAASPEEVISAFLAGRRRGEFKVSRDSFL